jgi:drug/metabolite transporter (DMT)-like permease
VLSMTDVITGTALVMTGSALSFWLYWLIGGERVNATFPDEIAGWTWIVLLSTISSVGGTAFFFAGLKRIGPSKSAIVSTSEPVMAIAAGVLFLSESLTIARIVGATFVIAALLLLAVFERRPRTATL